MLRVGLQGLLEDLFDLRVLKIRLLPEQFERAPHLAVAQNVDELGLFSLREQFVPAVAHSELNDLDQPVQLSIGQS